MTTSRLQSVVLVHEQEDRLADVARGLGLGTVVPGAGRRARLRTAVVADSEVDACVQGCTADAQPVDVRMIAGAAGFVAVVPEFLRSEVEAIAAAGDESLLVLVDVLMLLAARWDEALTDTLERAEQVGASLGGLRSAVTRRQIAEVRAHMVATRHRLSVHARLLAPGEDLVEALPAAGRRNAKRARLTFESAGATADQAYQLLGDVLSLQATTVNERLTLISIVFLPLTAATGFYGMNFGWLVDNITTPTAFWVSGVVVPVLFAVGVVMLFRRYDRAETADPPDRDREGGTGRR